MAHIEKDMVARVRKLYEKHPYPSPSLDEGLIYDTVIALDYVVSDLSGEHVLDAGCGTGQRLVALAQRFPDAYFLGIDISNKSLQTARELAEYHKCENVRFCAAEIGGAHLGSGFDLIVSSGVVHHLADPRSGAHWLIDHLNPTGLVYCWLYHQYGEFYRLLDRELYQLLDEAGIFTHGTDLLTLLGLGLEYDTYGTRASHVAASQSSNASALYDAYAHPIVNTYTISQAGALFRGFADWVGLFGVTWQGGAENG